MATLRKDGRWVARLRSQGQTVVAYGSTAEEAEEALRAKLTPSIEIPGPGATLHEFAKSFWYRRIQQRDPLTVKRYDGVYVNHLKAPFGNMPLDGIRPAHIYHWLDTSPASDYTKRYALDVLSMILGLAEKMDLIVKNPVRSVDFSHRSEKRERVLDLEHALTLLSAVKGTPLSAPVFLATVLGLRRGEIAGLKWQDLNRVKRELRIVRQRKAVRPHGVIETKLKTSESRRTLYLPEQILEEIDARGDLDSEYIATYKMAPWVPDTITEFWNKAKVEKPLKELGLADWHFHDLRHLAAGLLAAAGCDLIVIAAVLGHTNPDMSAIYTSVSEQRRREGADRLGALLTGHSGFNPDL